MTRHSSPVAFGDHVFLRIFDAHGERDSATRGKLRGHDCFARRARFHKVVEDAVGDRFVERALVPIRREIKLERFAFDAAAIGHVVDVDPSEVGLAGDGTKAGEVVGLEMNVIITSRWIWKCFQSRLGWRGGQFGLASTEQGQRCGLGFRALHRLNVPRSTANLQLAKAFGVNFQIDGQTGERI